MDNLNVDGTDIDETAEATDDVSAQTHAGPARDKLFNFLSGIEDGKYHSITADGTPEGDRMAEVAAYLEGRDRSALERMVGISIHLNTSASATAEMTRDVREVDSRAQAIAAATEELVASIREISDNSSAAAENARNANEAASLGNQGTRNAEQTMSVIEESVRKAEERTNRLEEASNNIGGFVTQIGTIANQTNLLALNATIEAARAGEAGKGFAVVASEVKSLSRETAVATENIRNMIEELQEEIKSIVEAMQESSAAVERGREVIAESGENIRTVAGLVGDVTVKMQDITSILEQQTAASDEISEGATGIAKMAAQNVVEVDQLADAMAAADHEITASMDETMTAEIGGKTILRAKSDHVIWKKRLAEMMIGRESLRAEELADHHSCRLGKWYDTAVDREILDHPAFGKLKDPHRAVHSAGIEAARRYAANDLNGAIEAIQQVEESSVDVLRYLDELLAVGRV